MTFQNLRLSDREFRSYVEDIDGAVAIRTVLSSGSGEDSLQVSDGSLQVVDKTYDSTTNSNSSSSVNPEWAHYTCAEHVVDEANVAAGTNYTVINMDGYRQLVLQVLGTGGVTFTAYATLSDDASNTNSTDTQWVDKSTELLGAASVVDSSALVKNDFIMYKKVMIKYVTSDSTNAVDVWARRS